MHYEHDKYVAQRVRSEKTQNFIIIKVLIKQQARAKFNYIRKFQ